jgi:hypothetical protein
MLVADGATADAAEAEMSVACLMAALIMVRSSTNANQTSRIRTLAGLTH